MIILAGIAMLLCPGFAAASPPEIGLDFPRTAGTVGDPFPMTLTASGTDSGLGEPQPLPDRIGPFHVLDGSWRKDSTAEGGDAWVWSGRLAAYETGELELPSFTVRFPQADEFLELTTEPKQVSIASVLGGSDEGEELADLKRPSSVEPDYRALFLAVIILVGLMAVAGAVWWIQRRFAGKLAAVSQPKDPFHRMPPHEWAYQALQELLRTGQADPERAGPFFQEISRILKLYLGGRFRVELMECTTSEIPPALHQAGAAEGSILKTEQILLRCDMVKFAGHRPESVAFRSAVEEAYALVDETRPAPAAGQGAT